MMDHDQTEGSLIASAGYWVCFSFLAMSGAIWYSETAGAPGDGQEMGGQNGQTAANQVLVEATNTEVLTARCASSKLGAGNCENMEQIL